MLARAVQVGGAATALAGMSLSWVAASGTDEHLYVVQPALSPKKFQEFEVTERKQLTHNTAQLRFRLKPNQELGLKTASCLVAAADIDGKKVVRPYTPTSRDHDKGFFELVVKTYPEGKLSKHMFNLKAGDLLEMKGPFQKIDVHSNFKKAVGLVAGGTGITPMLQIIHKLLEDPRDNTEIRLLYANNSPDEIILKNQLDALALVHPRFKVYYTVSEVPEGAKWDGYTGFVTPEMLAETMPPPSDDHMVFVCGPPPMVNAISGSKAKDKSQGELSGHLAKMQYTAAQVFKL